ncbi:hypothetical protein Pyrde_0756 [Pyrodictium delaneyi]|uniref:Uncharacterized protein n=1 Tax=Pyrodictium delaneyi TaxID=1273541 RepID=A0A0P0N2E8_9CREN|nr:hypothetical protein [Pyrodictium delaneyi]ALL00806.1 hypothetical protein Pyrde_0756 [Pyrodictium delaneyi]OWJ55560.1 hypothetical protein Pdsh_01865 [Pyrodictium delaneyi]
MNNSNAVQERICFSGSFSELISELLKNVPKDTDIPDAFVHAIRRAYVEIKGDCELLDELETRLANVIENTSPNDVFTTMLQSIAADSEKCSVSIMWDTIGITIRDPSSGKRIHITIHGAPLETILIVKKICGQNIRERTTSE